MSEADRLFEELGYKKADRKNTAEFYIPENNGAERIIFWKNDKEVSKNYDRDCGYITMEELKAMNKKCEELGGYDKKYSISNINDDCIFVMARNRDCRNRKRKFAE